MEEIVRQMRDIRLPESHFWWPPAPGWWLLGILSGALLLVLGMFLYRRGRLRRLALGELERVRQRFRQDGERRELAMALNVLLRRVTLARHPRREVAPLHGEAWLEFLDRTGGHSRFRHGPGRVLLQAPYAPEVPFDAEALLVLAEDWIRAAA